MSWSQHLIGQKPVVMPRKALLPSAQGMSPAEFSGAIRTPIDTGDLRYAWQRSLNRDVKPVMFTTLGALANHIHAVRGQSTVELEEGAFDDPDTGATTRIVSVYTLDFGSRSRLLGHAWLDGGGRDRLHAALDAAGPPPARRIRPLDFVRAH